MQSYPLSQELRRLFNLQRLWLNQTLVDDLTPIKDLTNLAILSLPDTTVRDLSPLQQLTSLEKLHLNGSRISELDALKSLIRLQYLDLADTQVDDLTALDDLFELDWLNVSNTQVDNLTPLQNLSNLRFLNLSRTPVPNLAPIKSATNLRYATSQNLTITSSSGVIIEDGLHFENTPVSGSDHAFRALVKLTNPERTIQTLQYLNGEHPKYGGPPKVEPENSKADQPTSTRRRDLIANPPATIVNRNGQIDFDPSEPSDTPDDPDDQQLLGLPKRQKNLAEQLAKSLGQQQPASTRALRHYADEIKPSGVLLEILKDAFITIRAGFEQAIREGALNDDTIAAWDTFQKNNTLFFAHYPFDLEREKLYRNAPIDIGKVDFSAMAEALSDLTKVLKEDEVAPSVGERFRDWAEVSEALSYQLRDEALRRGGVIETIDEPDIGYEYDLPLERKLLGFAAVAKRTVSQAWVMVKKLGEFLETKDVKSIKNVVWVGERLLGTAAILAALLYSFFI